MTRNRMSLDGDWGFRLDTGDSFTPNENAIDALPEAEWRVTPVPAPWQAHFDDLSDVAGTAWYRRSFEVPTDWLAGDTSSAIMLHFGAVDYFAEVWLNGTYVGSHEGGYLPFEFDVRRHLQSTNDLVVRVTDPTNNSRRYPDFPFAEIPHGKQSWYGQTSGLWQSVWLERRAKCHVRRLKLTPDLTTGQVPAELILSTEARDDVTATATVRAPDGAVVASEEIGLPAGTAHATIVLTVDEPRAWSPASPTLYTVEVTLQRGGTTIDAIEDTCGFRTIEARDGRLYLNGEPFYMRGALDQDYYLDTICTPPSVELIEQQFRAAKQMGLNTIRYHIKVADPRYYDVADRLGLLIWTEFPNFAYLSEAATRRAKSTIRGMIERDWNHPSIAIWTIINEDWGTNLVENESHRAWLREMYHWVKGFDPTRLVVDNSPNRLSFHVETDIADYHYYQAHPDGRAKWDAFMERMAARDESMLYSPNGDAVHRGDEPLIVSEFGVWGLPNIDLFIDPADEPFWMEHGLGFYEGVAYPHGVKDRFRRWHFDSVFGDWRSFVEATQWRQYYALKYQIETIRRRPELNGYVVTELTDVHWEVNGLMDMQRNPRVFADAFARLNTTTAVIAESPRTAYWAGEEVPLELIVSHQEGAPLRNAKLVWSLASGHGGGETALSEHTAGDVTSTEAHLTAPAIETAISDRLELAVHTDTTVAENHLNLAFFPQRAGVPDVRIWTQDNTLAERLTALGYHVVDAHDTADILAVRQLDDAAAGFSRQGGGVLVLADDPDAVGSYFSRVDIFSPQMQAIQREGTPWSGYWVTSFSWLRRQGPFAHVPGEPFLDQSFERVVPDYVLVGFSPGDFEENVYAGIFVGWVNKMAALIGERRYGQGKVVLTTFRLFNDPAGTDPVATSLLDGLIELTARK